MIEAASYNGGDVLRKGQLVVKSARIKVSKASRDSERRTLLHVLRTQQVK